MKMLFVSLLAGILGMQLAPRPGGQAPTAGPPRPAAGAAAAATKVDNARAAVVRVALAEVGTQEATGRNDGPVDKYLASVGLGGTRNPYCAAFVYWCGQQALGRANPFPRSAWSPDFVSGATYVKGRGPAGRPGDVFGLYYPSKGRIAHAGIIREWGRNSVKTIEANTSPEAASGSSRDRDGDGVWSKTRMASSLHVKPWLP